jgi:nucleoside-diphosphate-sugar epimerase
MQMMEAAAKESSVKNVVVTSSSTACVQPEPGKPYHVDSSTWNEASKAAWTLPPAPDFQRMLMNYSCAKTEEERACWDFVEKHKPNFTFNTVLPTVVFGKLTSPENTGFPSSTGALKYMWEGSKVGAGAVFGQWFVDSEDVALLHLAALTLGDVQHQRLIAFGHPFTWGEIIDIFKKLAPEREFMNRFEEQPDLGTVDNAKEIEILKRLGRKDGFKTLEESIGEWVPYMKEVEKKGIKLPETFGDKIAAQMKADA